MDAEEDDYGQASQLDMIVAFVQRPCSLRRIAAHTGHSIPSIRHQLGVLVEARRLTQLDGGFFAPAHFTGKGRFEQRQRSVLGDTVASALVAIVDRPMRVREVAAELSNQVGLVRQILQRLVERGHLSRPEHGIIAPAGFGASKACEDQLSIRTAVHASLTQPRRPKEVGTMLDIPPLLARRHLVDLMHRGQAVKVRHGLYGRPGAIPPEVAKPARPQRIRDMILAYVSEPRRAREIAAHIGRPIPTTTGHLAAMKRLGLVVQAGRGIYVRASGQGARAGHEAKLSASRVAA